MDIKTPKVREDLNLFSASGTPLVIKVLTDLENRLHTFSIDIKVLKDLKRRRAKKNGSRSSTEVKQRGGQAPALRTAEHHALHRSARACPSPSIAPL